METVFDGLRFCDDSLSGLTVILIVLLYVFIHMEGLMEQLVRPIYLVIVLVITVTCICAIVSREIPIFLIL